MRKSKVFTGVLIAATMIMVAGCAGTSGTPKEESKAAEVQTSGKEETEKTEGTEAESKSEGAFAGNDLIPVVDGVAEITCGATTTGGWTYMYTSSAAQVVSSNNDNINITPAITTGGGENLISVATGEMPMGVASAAYIYNN